MYRIVYTVLNTRKISMAAAPRVSARETKEWRETKIDTRIEIKSNVLKISQPQDPALKTRDFQKYISLLLAQAGLSEAYIEKLTVPGTTLNNFEQAFTHESVETCKNYEFYELMGDSCMNKTMTDYIIEKYHILRKPIYRGFISDLSQMIKEKEFLYKMGMHLNMLAHVKYDGDSIKGKSLVSIVEDVFESFCGCLEMSINELYPFTGYAIVYQFVKTQLDSVNWPLPSSPHLLATFNDLILQWNPTTGVKEIADQTKLLFTVITSNFVEHSAPKRIKVKSKTKSRVESDESVVIKNTIEKTGSGLFRVQVALFRKDETSIPWIDAIYGDCAAITEKDARKGAFLQAMTRLHKMGHKSSKRALLLSTPC